MIRHLALGSFAAGLCVSVSLAGCSSTTTNVGADAGPGSGTDGGPGSGTDGGSLTDGASGANPLGFTPSNVNLTGFDLSLVGDFVVDNNECSIDTESNLASCGDGGNVLAFQLQTQSDGTKVAVYVARSINIQSMQNLTVTGHNPIVLIALETIKITGSLFGNSRENLGSAGGHTQGLTDTKGAGPGGAGAPSAMSGGGGGSYCGIGGAGAVESGGTSPGGVAYGTVTNTPLVGGSSGSSPSGGGGGGSGGGAIQLIAGTSITVDASGVIHVGAGGGAFGGISGQEAAGGGSGGSILLESRVVSIAGTLAANGGGGGAGSSVNVPGGANATGNATAAAGGPGASAGGVGSAAAITKGSDGTFTAGNAGGGGGGGAGRIRINTKTGQATLSGTLSPAASTPCTTQGTVAP